MSTTTRLRGLDAARTMAVLGMFAAHVFPLYHRDGSGQLQATAAGLVASGRASALFMVLAGVSLGLFVRGLQHKGFGPVQRLLVIWRRAGVITVLGMLIGPANERIANILVHYGLLFAVLGGAVFLGSRVLGSLAAGWLLLTPVLWRPLAATWQEESLGHNPTFADLTQPGALLLDLTVTGYYPLLVWFGFGLLGLALSRLELAHTTVTAWLLAGGTVAAAASYATGWWMSAPLLARISRDTGWSSEAVTVALQVGRAPGGSLADFVASSQYVWLPAPHSTSLVATVHAAACAVAILGLLLLLADRLGYPGRLVAAAGRAPLTLYAGHLLVLPFLQEVASPVVTWWILCVLVVIAALILEQTRRSGPLEKTVSVLSGASTTKNSGNAR